MGCSCFEATKYILFGFNLFFWLAGGALLGVGIWLLTDPNLSDYFEIAGVEFYTGGAVFLTVIGVFFFVFGFFGCCGAIRESECLLTSYFVLLAIAFCMQVGLGVWAFVVYDSLQEAVTQNMAKLDLSNLDVQKSMTATQRNLECCGTTTGCADWQNQALPLESCACTDESRFNTTGCQKPPPECSVANYEYIYTQPCDDAVYQFIDENAVIIGSCALAIALLQIIQMIAVMGLCCSISGKKSMVVPINIQPDAEAAEL